MSFSDEMLFKLIEKTDNKVDALTKTVLNWQQEAAKKQIKNSALISLLSSVISSSTFYLIIENFLKK